MSIDLGELSIKLTVTCEKLTDTRNELGRDSTVHNLSGVFRPRRAFRDGPLGDEKCTNI